MSYTISWQDALVDSTNNTISITYRFLPHFIGAVLIFVIGLILANLTKKITIKLLQGLKLNKILAKTNYEEFLEKAEIKSRAEEIIGQILKWLVILIFTVAAVNILGVPTVSDILNSILAYIPNIIAAIFILAVGLFLAGLIEKLVKGSVVQINVKAGRLLGKIASYVMVIFASMAALNELGIARDLINILFVGFVSMLAIGFGLAIGLGAKDVVSEFLMEKYKQLGHDKKKK